MNANIVKYHITPRILKADLKQTVSVKGLDSSCAFLDDVDYIVTVTQKDGWDYNTENTFKSSGRKCTSTYTCRSIDGVLSFEHYFAGEVALYNQLLAEGIDLPIVASSDSHGSIAPGVSHFCDDWTVAFADCSENILECILNGMSVAVDYAKAVGTQGLTMHPPRVKNAI